MNENEIDVNTGRKNERALCIFQKSKGRRENRWIWRHEENKNGRKTGIKKRMSLGKNLQRMEQSLKQTKMPKVKKKRKKIGKINFTITKTLRK